MARRLESAQAKRVLLGLLKLGSLVVLALVGYWVFRSTFVTVTISDENFNRIKTGMSKDDVRAVLGNAIQVDERPDGITYWCYCGPGEWSGILCSYYVSFDRNGNVEFIWLQ